jgi:hypothetical protein
MEVEYKGISMKGGKLFIIISLLGTLGGGLWGAFEFWKDYQTLQQRVNDFISPDMSKYDEQIAVLKSEVSMVLEEVSLVNDVAQSLKNDLRDDIKTMKADIRAIDKVVNDIEDRVKANEREISEDFKILEKEIDDNIKKSLSNPLAGIK